MSDETKMFWMGVLASFLVCVLLAVGGGWIVTRMGENAAKMAFSQAVKDLAEAQRANLLPSQGTKFVIAYKDKEGMKIIPKMYDTVEVGLKDVPADAAQGEIRVMTLKAEK